MFSQQTTCFEKRMFNTLFISSFVRNFKEYESSDHFGLKPCFTVGNLKTIFVNIFVVIKN